jgi:CBS domain-containing protein
MNIKDIMNRHVESVTPDTRLHEVMKKMRSSDCGCVIVSENDKLVGIVTDRDIAIKCVVGVYMPLDTMASEIMTPDVLYCRETDKAAVVAISMAENKIRRLVVLNDEKKMVGVVTLGDLAVLPVPIVSFMPPPALQ